MRKVSIIAASIALLVGATVVQAAGPGTGGPPTTDPDPGNPGDNPGGDDGPVGGGGTPGGGGGGGTPTPGVSTAPTGVGTIFTLENMPVGVFNPFRDYTNPFGYTIPSQQGVLTQTVGGYTLALTTAPYTLSFDPAAPQETSVGIADESIFQYAPTFADIGAIGTRSAYVRGPGEIYASFSSGITDFSLLAYDFANDTDFVTLNAYSGVNGTGSLISSITLPTANNAAIPLYSSSVISFSGLNGARSVGISNSTAVFYDNISAVFVGASAVPEPATWAMMITGFGMIGAAARRRPAKTTAAIA